MISKQFMQRMTDDMWKHLNTYCLKQLDVLYYMSTSVIINPQFQRYIPIESYLWSELIDES